MGRYHNRPLAQAAADKRAALRIAEFLARESLRCDYCGKPIRNGDTPIYQTGKCECPACVANRYARIAAGH